MNIKKIICLISAVLIVLINLSLTAYAAETTISDTEAKKLILGAHNLYLTYQDGIYDTVKHEIVTTTKEAVSKEAKKIYIEEIADDMWMYRCDLGAEYCKSFDGLPYIEKDVQGWFDGMKYQIYNIDGKRIDMYRVLQISFFSTGASPSAQIRQPSAFGWPPYTAFCGISGSPSTAAQSKTASAPIEQSSLINRLTSCQISSFSPE